MSTLTIRQLDERTDRRLRQQAAEHGRSVAAEVRATLNAVVNPPRENFCWLYIGLSPKSVASN